VLEDEGRRSPQQAAEDEALNESKAAKQDGRCDSNSRVARQQRHRERHHGHTCQAPHDDRSAAETVGGRTNDDRPERAG